MCNYNKKIIIFRTISWNSKNVNHLLRFDNETKLFVIRFLKAFVLMSNCAQITINSLDDLTFLSEIMNQTNAFYKSRSIIVLPFFFRWICKYSYLSYKCRVWKRYLNLKNEGSGINEGPGFFVTLYKEVRFTRFSIQPYVLFQYNICIQSQNGKKWQFSVLKLSWWRKFFLRVFKVYIKRCRIQTETVFSLHWLKKMSNQRFCSDNLCI